MDYFMMKKKLKDFGFYTRDKDDPLSLLKVMHVPKKAVHTMWSIPEAVTILVCLRHSEGEDLIPYVGQIMQ